MVGAATADLEKEEDGSFQNGTLKAIDKLLKGILTEVVKEEDFTGKAGQSILLRVSGYNFKRIGLVAYQNSGVLTAANWKSFGESVVTATKAAQATSLGLTLANFGHVDEAHLHLTAHSISLGMSLRSIRKWIQISQIM